VTVDEDPGWWPAIKRLPRSLIPFIDFPPTRRRASRPDLIKLRTMHLSMAATLVLLVIAFSVIEVEEEAGHEAWGWLAVGVTTVIALLEIWSTGRRMRVMPANERSAADRWRALYFIRVGMVMVPALAAFAMSFLGAGRGPYLAGVAISELLLIVIAPSHRHLSDLTELYRRDGRDIDLIRALLRDPPGGEDSPE
jgi:hypothetical protein